MRTNPLSTLREMLTYCRPHGSKHHDVFVRQFVAPLPGAYADRCGNYHVHVDDSPVLWSCHTDTVHNKTGRQHVTLSGDWIELAPGSKSTCLGADDTAGVWLMRELVRAKVPGHYVFHVGEERGGIGSSWLARNYADWLRTFNIAIALDRAGTRDIITHQTGGRTASDTFAYALAGMLGADWEPAHGVYTDTAEYSDLIAECTNLSVGYQGQHWKGERQHVGHLYELLSLLLTLDVTALPVVRTPGDDGWNDYDHWPISNWRYRDDSRDRDTPPVILAWPDPNDDPCETCADLQHYGLIGTRCPDCGAVVRDWDDDVYLDRSFAEAQRELRAQFNGRKAGA